MTPHCTTLETDLVEGFQNGVADATGQPPERHISDGSGLPKLFASRKTALIKGYSQDNRIKYGTGRIVDTAHLLDNAGDIFQTPDVAYIHVRSAHNNCLTCRIDKTGQIQV